MLLIFIIKIISYCSCKYNDVKKRVIKLYFERSKYAFSHKENKSINVLNVKFPLKNVIKVEYICIRSNVNDEFCKIH